METSELPTVGASWVLWRPGCLGPAASTTTMSSYYQPSTCIIHDGILTWVSDNPNRFTECFLCVCDYTWHPLVSHPGEMSFYRLRILSPLGFFWNTRSHKFSGWMRGWRVWRSSIEMLRMAREVPQMYRRSVTRYSRTSPVLRARGQMEARGVTASPGRGAAESVLVNIRVCDLDSEAYLSICGWQSWGRRDYMLDGTIKIWWDRVQ